jgi:hypothetical protein
LPANGGPRLGFHRCYFEVRPLEGTMADELTEFETKLLKWLVKSEFHLQPWSTKDAAKAFKVSEDEVYEAVAALSKKAPERIQIFYKEGAVHIAAD